MKHKTIDALKRFYKFFRGPRMTIIIIAVLLFLFLLGLIIPQKALYRSNLQYEQWRLNNPVLSGIIVFLRFNDIYAAPVTVLFLGLFFANLLVVIGHRVPVVLRRSYLTGKSGALAAIGGVEALPNVKELVVERCAGQQGMGGLAVRVSGWLKKRWWSVIATNEPGAFIAIKNRLSPIGFLLFHLSFVLCFAGGILVMYTRFSGNLVLTEGQEFNSDIKQFRTIKNDPKIFHALPELGILLNKVAPHYEHGTGTDLVVSAKVRYFSDVRDEVVRVNEPIKKGAVSILAQDVGFSPLMVLRDADGRVVQSGYYSLKIEKGDEDSLEFQQLPYKVFVRFYPDYAEEGGKAITRSRDLRNPVMKLRVEKAGKVLYDGLRTTGQPALFDSYSLFFDDIRYWVDFYVVREYGVVPIFIGFLFGVAGLIMRLVFYQKILRVRIATEGDDCKIYIAGRSEYNQQTFQEEFELLVKDMTRDLSTAGGSAI